MSSPPVTRLLDYGQFKYEQARKEKEARKHQRSVEFKEVRLRVKIGKGDFDTKVRRAIRFLEEGDRVKVTVQFRGREVSHAYIGRDLLNRFAELVEEHGSVDRPPILEGRSMSMVLTSTHKPGSMPAKSDEQPEGSGKSADKAGKAAKQASEAEKPPAKADENETKTEAKAEKPPAKADENETKSEAKAEKPPAKADENETKTDKEAEPEKPAPPVAKDEPETQAATTTGG